MSKASEDFFNKMLEFLPSTKNEYTKSVECYGEVLETVIIEDIFMPIVIKLLEEDRNNLLLKDIFDYFESVSTCKDDHLINIFTITTLEILGNDSKTLETAKKYMGPKTALLQMKADKGLGRI
jgi:hypothetical protein